MTLPMQPGGKRSHFFENEGMDHLLAMVIELSTQLWITRERLTAVESIIHDADSSFIDKVEKWEPNSIQAEDLAEMRQTMLANIFRTLEVERPGPSDKDVVKESSA